MVARALRVARSLDAERLTTTAYRPPGHRRRRPSRFHLAELSSLPRAQPPLTDLQLTYGQPDRLVLTPCHQRRAQDGEAGGAVQLDLIEGPNHAMHLDRWSYRCPQPPVARQKNAARRALSQSPGRAIVKAEFRMRSFKGHSAVDERTAQPDHPQALPAQAPLLAGGYAEQLIFVQQIRHLDLIG